MAVFVDHFRPTDVTSFCNRLTQLIHLHARFPVLLALSGAWIGKAKDFEEMVNAEQLLLLLLNRHSSSIDTDMQRECLGNLVDPSCVVRAWL